MTNNELYKNKMAEKINWYKSNGFKTVENGGKLIYTYYTTDIEFAKNISKYIRLIRTT